MLLFEQIQYFEDRYASMVCVPKLNSNIRINRINDLYNVFKVESGRLGNAAN